MFYRAWLLAFCFASLSALFIGRLFWLQIVHGERFASDISQDRLVSNLIPARRGRILDRHGEVIVDNRNVYDLSLVLQDLCLSYRETRRIPFIEINAAALTQFTAELALRIGKDSDLVRKTVIEELERNPGVAIRHRRGAHTEAAKLVVIPSSSLELDALTADEQEKVAGLFERRLISRDPRRAISNEIKAIRQEDALLLNSKQIQELGSVIDQQIGLGTQFATDAIKPFLENIHISFTKIDPKLPELHYYMLDAERLDQIIRHLSEFSNSDVEDIRSSLLDCLDSLNLRESSRQWYFTPHYLAQDINNSLPLATTQHNLAIHGLPPNRERIFIVQADQDDGQGFYPLLLNRIKTNLDIDVDWLQALLEEHCTTISAFRSGRRYRKKQVALDYQSVTTLITRLAATLDKSGIPCTALDAESYLTEIRRITDREWHGYSRRQALSIVSDIPRQLAIGLSGSGLQAPTGIVDDYQNADAFLPGIRVSTHNGREYRYPGLASHIIGYLGRVDSNMSREEALSIGLDPSGKRGRSGLEARYDHILQGSTGLLVKHLDEKTRQYQIDKQRSRDPLPGQDLRTTLDMQLQEQCQYAVEHWYPLAQKLGLNTSVMDSSLGIGKGRAGIVMMDVQNGAILGMASSPSFDLSGFNNKFKQLLEDKSQPMIDNATIANRHPGSIVKVLVALAGLHEGVITTETVMHCQGYMALDSRGRKILRDHAYGDLDAAMSIAKSSNVFYATVGARLGPKKLLEWYHRFGLGRKYSYDIPWQRPQILPSPDNIKEQRPTEPHWNNYDTWSISIGQFIKISPLEAITIPACVANGGTIVKPHLVQPSEPIIHDFIPFKESHLREVREGMEKAVTIGTVPHLRLADSAAGIRVAAKTGTAQWGRSGNKYDHAWLIGYAPLKNPKVCFCIFVHSGSSGGRACTGVAKHVLETYFKIYGPNGHRR